MESEDKLIKSLLEEHLMEKAPEGFTRRVMDAVYASENKEYTPAESNDWPYVLVAAATVIFGFGTLFVIEPALISNYYLLMLSYAAGFVQQMTDIFSAFHLQNIRLTSGDLPFAGIIFIILSLLLFDRLVIKKKSSLNLFFRI